MAFGVFARLLRSDLSIPESISRGISVNLLLAIGLNGGAVRAVTPPSQLLLPGADTPAIGVLTPLSAWPFMRNLAKMAHG